LEAGKAEIESHREAVADHREDEVEEAERRLERQLSHLS
jgi:hypothetical protein